MVVLGRFAVSARVRVLERLCRAERYSLSRLERFASIEIHEGRLAEYIEGDVIVARLSIDPERRSGDIAGRKCSLDEGDGGVALRHRQGRFLAL